jgi:hypothetical protein
MKKLIAALLLIPGLAFAQTYSYSPPPPPPPDAAPQPSGQWVYTQEYGYVWMPYGDQYVSQGSAYVFRVGIGWRWVAAPWLYGPRFHYWRRVYPRWGWGWHHWRHW